MKHSGAISKITGSTITVALDGNINCEGCKAKAACGASESPNKTVEIERQELSESKNGGSFRLHETVDVRMQAELGLKAVFWAYIFPFILMLFVLIIASAFVSEWQAGLFSLAILIPYYGIIHYLNPVFKKKFKISIQKLT